MTLRTDVVRSHLDPDVEDVESNEYGEDHYCYIDGQRYKVGCVRTLHPREGDTNADFEGRVHRTVQRLYAKKAVASVTLHFRKQAGALTECVFHIVYSPQLAPLLSDDRPARGRFGERGQRGGAGRREAPTG